MVAGVMSGTCGDGIDVALVRVLGRGYDLRFELLGHDHFEYPRAVREVVLKAMNGKSMKVADLSRLNFLLGELYAEAVLSAKRNVAASRLDLAGCHGQTIYPHADPAPYLGRKVAATCQTGEGALIAAEWRGQ